MANRRDLVRCVRQGLEWGQDQYEQISGGCWAYEGAEYWLTVHVARRLWELVGDGLVTVEGKTNEAMAAAGRRSGRPPLIVDKKRFDIVIWNKNGAARAPIEIKSKHSLQGQMGDIIHDTRRIIAALKRSEMKFGIVGYYYSADNGKNKAATERIKSYVKSLKNKCMEYEESSIRISSQLGEIHGDEEYAWIAGCLLIEETQTA